MPSDPRSQPTVLLVDAHPAVREALAQLLQDNGLAVCAQASGREEALAYVAGQWPDLALVDLSLGEEDGLALVSDLHKLGILVVVFSSHEDAVYVRRALDLGARAYLAKRDAGRTLVRTLRDVLDGWVLVSPHAAEELPPAGGQTPLWTLKEEAPVKASLTPRGQGEKQAQQRAAPQHLQRRGTED